MLRYLKLLGIQLRTSATTAMQYRVDFLVKGALSVLWMALTIVPILAVFARRQALPGWTFDGALVVTGWFTLMEGVLEGAVNPSLVTVVEHIRKGTLDLVLIKPADAQFLVSTARFEPWRAINVLGALAIFAYAFHRIGHWPSPLEVAAALLLLACATVVIYSLWILVVSAAFYVVKMDNLTYLLSSVFDAARWPVTVFPRPIRLFLTLVIPLAVMTTFPAYALLGQLGSVRALQTLVGAAAFAALSRFIWTRAIGRYTSASS